MGCPLARSLFHVARHLTPQISSCKAACRLASCAVCHSLTFIQPSTTHSSLPKTSHTIRGPSQQAVSTHLYHSTTPTTRLTMSFLYRTTPICRVAATSSSRPAARCFTTSLVQQKGPVEATKDVLKKVDRTVSDAAVSGIEKGQ